MVCSDNTRLMWNGYFFFLFFFITCNVYHIFAGFVTSLSFIAFSSKEEVPRSKWNEKKLENELKNTRTNEMYLVTAGKEIEIDLFYPNENFDDDDDDEGGTH